MGVFRGVYGLNPQIDALVLQRPKDVGKCDQIQCKSLEIQTSDFFGLRP